MAISNEITRLTTLRNNIRTKLIGLGILPAASTSATLSECYNVLSSVTGLGASSYTPTTTTQTIASGQYLSGAQTINAIPSAYIIPAGTKNITSNGTVDVASFASASVNVQPALQSKTVTPTSAVQSVTPDVGVYGLSKVTVNAIPSAYIIPSGTVTLSQPGTFDVARYASADVTAAGGGPSGPYVEYYGYNSQSEEWSIKAYIPDGTVCVPNGFCDFDGVTNAVARRRINNDNIAFSSVIKVGNHAFKNAGFGSTRYSSGIVFGNSAYSSTITFCQEAFCGATDIGDININTTGKIIFESNAFDGCGGPNLIAPFCKYLSFTGSHSKFLLGAQCNFDYFSFPAVVNISGMLANHSQILSVYLPVCISVTGFKDCIRVSSIYAPLLVSAYGVGAFAGMTAMSYMSFPNLQYTYNSSAAGAFENNANLISIYMPLFSRIQRRMFLNCSRLESITMSTSLSRTVLDNVCSSAFYGCYSLQSIPDAILNNATEFSGCSQIFQECRAIKNVTLNNVILLKANSAFYGCYSLNTFSIPKCSILSGSAAFRFCYNLISIFLLGSSVCALGNTIMSMFASTPVSSYSTSAGRFASIFVPSSLLASYKAATNWTTISSKIFAYETYFGALPT